ncbi:HisA/HisF-related TIM barrel protein [Actinopolyspora mortivallis]|uniref:Imidazole glycerol phosphate synthase subunit HisF n=1 Tax=Actinopolyspora mortivallis TaxID=33906 RepID=A0A2T0GWL9_ACTMO|nr:HisA/HisF-related TIM barrel protein [Actinopolyspora mortivallis]PRW63509.1 imidazole glycerol phosphate synthase subunit HisF [Actinopolyspora mortivallis]
MTTDDTRVVDVLIPCVDLARGRATDPVRLPGVGDPHDPVDIARCYAAWGVRRVFLDVLDDWDELHTVTPVVSAVRETGVSVLVSVGHGVLRSVAEAERLLRAGAAALSVSTALVESPRVVEDFSRRTGRLMGAVNAGTGPLGAWTAHVHGGRVPSGMDAAEFARRLGELGAGLVLANSAEREGTGAGYDHRLTRKVAVSSAAPVIASGGCGSVAHLVEALESGTADYVLANKALHAGRLPRSELRRRWGVPEETRG